MWRYAPGVRCACYMLVFVGVLFLVFFFFNDTATTEIYTLSLHDALPIYGKFEATGANRVQVPHLFRSDDDARSEERFSRNAETDIVCRLLLVKKKKKNNYKKKTTMFKTQTYKSTFHSAVN